jgi:hypothetical protein
MTQVGDTVRVSLTVDGRALSLEGVVTDVAEPIRQATVSVEYGGRTHRVCLPLEALGARPARSSVAETKESKQPSGKGPFVATE